MTKNILTYYSIPQLRATADFAAKTWNSFLGDLIEFKEIKAPLEANVVVEYGYINTIKYPGRVAECISFGNNAWDVIFSNKVKWAFSWLDRALGRGEDARTAMVHEFGHVIGLPHASSESFVMHPEMGGNGRLGKKEKKLYRDFVLKNLAEKDGQQGG
jgi:hypothetical protein